MPTPHLSLVSGHSAARAATHPAVLASPEAFLHTLEIARRQARQLMADPDRHSIEVRRLCRTLLDEARAAQLFRGADQDSTVEPFIGA